MKNNNQTSLIPSLGWLWEMLRGYDAPYLNTDALKDDDDSADWKHDPRMHNEGAPLHMLRHKGKEHC